MYGIDKTTTLVGTGGVASRLMDDAFWARLQHCITTYGIDRATTLVGKGGVASRLMDGAFWARLQHCINEHGIDRSVTWINIACTSLQSFCTFLHTMVQRYGKKSVHSCLTQRWTGKVCKNEQGKIEFDRFMSLQ